MKRIELFCIDNGLFDNKSHIFHYNHLVAITLETRSVQLAKQLERENSRREFGVLPEGELRAFLLARLHGLNNKKQMKIIRMFQMYRPAIDPEMVMPYFEHAIHSAVRSYQWEGTRSPENVVGIGFYQTPAEYFATFLHESGHNILQLLGRSNEEYTSDEESEEDFCWRFSRYVCTLLDLPFSRDREHIDRSFCLLTTKLAQKLTLQDVAVYYDNLIEQEVARFGFSRYGNDTFRWNNDGVPEKCDSTLVR